MFVLPDLIANSMAWTTSSFGTLRTVSSCVNKTGTTGA